MVHGKENILNITANMWPYKDKDLASYLISFFFTYEHCLLFWRDITQENGLWSTPRRQLH